MTFLDETATITITAPSGVDGRAEVAQINGATTDTHFVGYLTDSSGAATVRESADNVPEGHGAVHGSFYHGRFEFTLEVKLQIGATYAASFTRRDKLYRAFNAMASDGTVAWTDSGGSARQLSFRRQQSPRGPDKEGKVLLAGVQADPRIYSGGSEVTQAAATSLTIVNSGNAPTPPRFTVASPSAGIVFTNSTTGQALTFSGLDGSGTLTVDFKNRTVDRGGTNKYGKVVFPTSVWWELAPGSNSVTVTNAAAPFHRHAWIV